MDEISETSLSFQVKLLRVIQEKEFLIIKENGYSQIDLNFNSKLTLAEMEKEYIQRVLNSVKWNKNEAKKILGKALYYQKVTNGFMTLKR